MRGSRERISKRKWELCRATVRGSRILNKFLRWLFRNGSTHFWYPVQEVNENRSTGYWVLVEKADVSSSMFEFYSRRLDFVVYSYFSKYLISSTWSLLTHQFETLPLLKIFLPSYTSTCSSSHTSNHGNSYSWTVGTLAKYRERHARNLSFTKYKQSYLREYELKRWFQKYV